MTIFVLLNLFHFQAIFLSCITYLLLKEHSMYHHLVRQNIFCRCIRITILLQKIIDEYSELARNKAMKTRASRVNAIFEFYSTRLARYFFFNIKFLSSESSKMSTLVFTRDVFQISRPGCLIEPKNWTWQP